MSWFVVMESCCLGFLRSAGAAAAVAAAAAAEEATASLAREPAQEQKQYKDQLRLSKPGIGAAPPPADPPEAAAQLALLKKKREKEQGLDVSADPEGELGPREPRRCI